MKLSRSLLTLTLALALPMVMPAQEKAKVETAETAWKALQKKKNAKVQKARATAKSRQEFYGILRQEFAGLDEEFGAFFKKFPKSPNALKALTEQIGILNMLRKTEQVKAVELQAKALVAAKLKTAKTAEEISDLAMQTARLNKSGEAGLKVIEDAIAKTKDKEVKADLAFATLRFKGKLEKAQQIKFFQDLVKAHPGTKAAKKAAIRIQALDLGPGSPPLSMSEFKDITGKTIDLAKYKGKVLLIDFWATWCGPCMRELPNVLKAYELYHDKGFEILGISLDKDRAKFDQTIKDKGMTWRHYFDGLYWQNKIGQIYGVNSIPKTILLGPDGKIVVMNLRGQKLIDKVGELLGKEGK